MEHVLDIRLWMEHNAKVLEDAVLSRKIPPGYRVLFYGPAGTGKTLTATLLGKAFELPVYRIDLSQVVSKYIGETEKHIEWVFSRAARKKWILFFDEADALFGKRTSVQSAHDKYANQEVAYLLQRIEEYDGLLILASNFKNNIDDAFLRRFQTIIHFPMPSASERQKLWQGCVPASLPAEEALLWKDIAAQYEITGAGIVNVMHYAALRAFARGDEHLRRHDVIEGIRKEFRKEEKAI
jgi:SpoVK/Ycf46/Vps4 family AAA+-type ATPase